MRTEVPVFKRCCFCIPMRYGLLLWAYVTLVPNALLLMSDFWVIDYMVKYSPMNAIEITRFSFSLLLKVSNFFVTFLLIVAAHMKSVKLLTIFYTCQLISVAANFVMIVSYLVFDLVSYWEYLGERNRLWLYVIIDTLLKVVFVGFQFYIIAMVRSKILKMESSEEFRFVNLAAKEEAEYYDNQASPEDKGLQDKSNEEVVNVESHVEVA